MSAVSTTTTPTHDASAAPPSDPLDVAVIVASTREGRRAEVVADWFVSTISDRADIRLDVIDLVDVDLPERFTFTATTAMDDLRSRIARADAFVVVTPEYNHSYPAPLKHAIDFAKEQWKRKVVGFVSYGGVSGGLRAVEHLRGVFAELHVHGVRDTVSFHGPWNGFDDDGRPRDEAGAQLAAKVLVDELVWWGEALRAARDAAAA